MGNISTYLQQIMNAVYGEQVRSAIHDAINQCYIDASAGITPTITVTPVDGGTRVDIAVGADIISFVVQNGTATTQEVQYYVTEWLEENPDFYTTEVELLSDYIDDLATTGTYTKKNFYRCTSGRNSGTAITENSKQAYVVLTQEEATAHSIIYDNSVYAVEVIKVRDGSVISQSIFVTTSPVPYLDGTYDTAIINFKRQDTADLTAMERRLTLFYESSVGGVALASDLDDKVDKVTGKGLSTEDYTTAEKTKLAGLTQIEVDDTLSVEGRAADAKITGEKFNTINEIIALKDRISVPFKIKGSGYIGSNGNASTNSTTASYTDYINVSGYEKIVYTRCRVSASSTAHYDAFYNANKEYIASRRNRYGQESDGYTEEEYTLPEGTVYARFTTWSDIATYGDFGIYRTDNALAEKISDLESGIGNIENTAIQSEITTGINKYNPEKATIGYISNNTGNISTSSDNYVTTDFIPVKAGQSVYINRIRNFLAYDTDKNPITLSYVSTLTNNYVYTAEQDGYIRASLYTSYASSNIVAYATSKPAYEPYEETVRLGGNAHLSDTMTADAEKLSGNVFNGKKWVACGDSFTAGSFTNSLTDDYTFTDAPYYGKNKVYPYFIGRRNPSMTVINEAISGSTMGAGENGINPFSDARYLAIPDDADYITMEFGINDSGDDVPLGTIDDITNETFYGAWNVVLDYFTQNFPFAHIGIIVGPGMQTTKAKTYAEAEIAIAKKWGIPYLNVQFESGGGKIPLMLRTSNPDVASPVKTLRNNQQYVNPNEGTLNMHPNEKAHEFESAFIEAWLRTL